MKIPITKPYLYRQEEELVLEVLRSGWLTQGEQTTKFEQMVADYVGTKYAVACNSCTTALFLCLKMLGIGQGDEVIVPSYTFIATPNAVVQVGAKPVFADIDLETYNISPQDIERKITRRTKAIIPVDQVGLPADLKAIGALAKKYKLKIIEDAACALGSRYYGDKIGNVSELNCFSFHPRKLITTGEGGMITTNNFLYAKQLRMLVSHGASVSEVARHKAKNVVQEAYPIVGYNFRLSNIQGAMGVAQMKKLGWILKRRVSLARRYNRAFIHTETIIPPLGDDKIQPNYQTYMVRLTEKCRRPRARIIEKLAMEGIAVRSGIMASHLEPHYKKMYPRLKLANTEKAFRQCLILPLYPELSEKEQDFVIENLIGITK
jgi:perosamine synthetase